MVQIRKPRKEKEKSRWAVSAKLKTLIPLVIAAQGLHRESPQMILARMAELLLARETHKVLDKEELEKLERYIERWDLENFVQ